MDGRWAGWCPYSHSGGQFKQGGERDVMGASMSEILGRKELLGVRFGPLLERQRCRPIHLLHGEIA